MLLNFFYYGVYTHIIPKALLIKNGYLETDTVLFIIQYLSWFRSLHYQSFKHNNKNHYITRLYLIHHTLSGSEPYEKGVHFNFSRTILLIFLVKLLHKTVTYILVP